MGEFFCHGCCMCKYINTLCVYHFNEYNSYESNDGWVFNEYDGIAQIKYDDNVNDKQYERR